ncbi:Serine/threonine protein kinase [Nocardiopsis flavescens]|uniref:Serine/threonine protein kinase n=1 Tax=Nocardiopsis flavescens TaxID=758803 RepID=A0A1M6C8M0_9ACTN|nr:serine/threonine-protein kinase [Nocardiopsis flavescens]SHI57253.1 Serine/threonine protein kinase [Nocardiopsis flavescens]
MEPLHPGDPRAFGRYRTLRRIGAGGMGVVFLAVTDGDGADLAAVKSIRPEYASDAEFRARFAGEAALARRVRGPYTARVLDADTEGPTPWLATEYIAGPSLQDAVRESGPFPEESLRVLAAGLAEALAAIHAVDLVHRDLKPSNVLLSPRGPQVIDFGIARAADATALTRTGQSLGTPAYMSPEQATGRGLGPRSDLFSFGGVLVFAATGRPPFGTGDPAALLYRVVNEPVDLDGVPAPLLPLVRACLAKDPRERPSLDGVAADLAGTDLPGAGARDATVWLPPRVADEVARTVVAATRLNPTAVLPADSADALGRAPDGPREGGTGVRGGRAAPEPGTAGGAAQAPQTAPDGGGARAADGPGPRDGAAEEPEAVFPSRGGGGAEEPAGEPEAASARGAERDAAGAAQAGSPAAGPVSGNTAPGAGVPETPAVERTGDPARADGAEGAAPAERPRQNVPGAGGHSRAGAAPRRSGLLSTPGRRRGALAAAALAVGLATAQYVVNGTGDAAPQGPVAEEDPAPVPGGPTVAAGARVVDTSPMAPSSRFAALSDAGLHLFESDRQDRVRELTLQDERRDFRDSELAATPEGTVLAAQAPEAAGDGVSVVHVWDVAGDERYAVALPDGSGDDGHIALSADGGTLFAATGGGEVSAYRVSTGARLYTSTVPASGGDRPEVLDLAVTRETEELLVVTLDTGLMVWDAATGEAASPRTGFREAPEELLGPASVSHTGEAGALVAVAAAGSVLLWRLESDGPPREFRPRPTPDDGSDAVIGDVSFSHYGDGVVVAGTDSERDRGFLMVWDWAQESVLAREWSAREFVSVDGTGGNGRLLVSFRPVAAGEPYGLALLEADLTTVQEYRVVYG